MRHAFAITLLVVTSTGALAQPAVVHADANPAAEAEIRVLDSKLAEWIVRGQWDEYSQHLAADYLNTSYNGHVENKEEALAALRDEHRKIIVMEPEPEDQVVRVYADTAVFNSEFTVAVRESGQLKSRRIRLIHVFVRREGQWYLIVGNQL